MNILLIDDSRAVHAFLNSILSPYQIQIEHAYQGKEGIQEICDQNIQYDLILLDWEMPEMTGPEVVIELRGKQVKTPIIMVTSKNELQDIQKMIEKGVTEYVMKPFTAEILVEKLESVLGKKVEKCISEGDQS